MKVIENYYYATGKRKEAVAKVWMRAGKGEILVNDKSLEDYFPREAYRKIVKEPLELVGFLDRFDVEAQVKGGGLTGQAGALRLGIARVIAQINPELRKTLKKAGFLTRDARVKERKKPGLRGARAKPQTSKR
ncbi:MAG TPA: 30S ribosomal protein S9 [Candidatus Aerophobetes bacterium]|uniref:Small ribosomal subunit protein uS9 n=2 Tax=Aerophobetes bacterium TaxID=2030807 RepID=A0A7V0QSK1_UNCAE|nr:30S ribosomal protein S9 [Candidatus Aerophobetes bacterium]